MDIAIQVEDTPDTVHYMKQPLGYYHKDYTAFLIIAQVV